MNELRLDTAASNPTAQLTAFYFWCYSRANLQPQKPRLLYLYFTTQLSSTRFPREFKIIPGVPALVPTFQAVRRRENSKRSIHHWAQTPLRGHSGGLYVSFSFYVSLARTWSCFPNQMQLDAREAEKRSFREVICCQNTIWKMASRRRYGDFTKQIKLKFQHWQSEKPKGKTKQL